MISTPTTAAYLIGTPDVALDLKEGGKLRLDSTQAPHVTAEDITVTVPDEATLARIDRRQSARIRLECNGHSFNLGVRDRSVSQSGGTVTVQAASDEALALDWAPMADIDLWDYRASLRSIVNQTLGQIGATLAASPTVDADCTPTWDQTNLIPNPNARIDATGWGSTIDSGAATVARGTSTLAVEGASPGYGMNLTVTTAGTGLMLLRYGTSTANNIPGLSENVMYTAAAYIKQDSGSAKTLRLWVGFKDSNNKTLKSNIYEVAGVASDDWTKITVTLISPPGTTSAALEFGVSNGMSAGKHVYLRCPMLVEGARSDVWFDGDRADDSAYTYGYAADDGTPPAASTRTALTPRDPDSIVWHAGVSALDFLLPLVQAAGYRLVCDGTRTWTLRDTTYQATGTTVIRYGQNLIDGTDDINADSDWFDAQATVYTWTDRKGNTQTRTDTYTLADPYTRLNLVEIASAYPGQGLSEYAVKRAQGRGRVVTATALADYTTQADQPASIVLAGAPRQVGTIDTVEFDLSGNEMTITARTVDVVPGTIFALTGTIDSLTGTINSLT